MGILYESITEKKKVLYRVLVHVAAFRQQKLLIMGTLRLGKQVNNKLFHLWQGTSCLFLA